VARLPAALAALAALGCAPPLAGAPGADTGALYVPPDDRAPVTDGLRAAAGWLGETHFTSPDGACARTWLDEARPAADPDTWTVSRLLDAATGPADCSVPAADHTVTLRRVGHTLHEAGGPGPAVWSLRDDADPWRAQAAAPTGDWSATLWPVD
jgi:hypothetical protein